MKNLKLIAIAFIIPLFIISCGDSAANKRRKDSLYQDSIKQFAAVAKQDSLMQDSIANARSLNRVDANGMRQGYWKITGKMANDPAYAADAIVKEGRYVDGKEDGEWLTHDAKDSTVMVVTTYKIGVVDENNNSTSGNSNARGINFIDANGKKQGHWIIYGNMQKDKSYTSDAKVEEGNYLNNEKDGLWTTYNPDGSVKKTISIKNRK